MKLNQNLILTIINDKEWSTQRDILNTLIEKAPLSELLELKNEVASNEKLSYLIEKKIFQDFTNAQLQDSLTVLDDKQALLDFSHLLKKLSKKNYHSKTDFQTYQIINSIYFKNTHFNEFIYQLSQDKNWQEKENILFLITQKMSLIDIFSLNKYLDEKINEQETQKTQSISPILMDYLMGVKASQINNNMELKVFLHTLKEKNQTSLIENEKLIFEIVPKAWANQNTFDIFKQYYSFDNNDKLYYIYSELQKNKQNTEHNLLNLMLNKLVQFDITITDKNTVNSKADTFFAFLSTHLLNLDTKAFLDTLSQLNQHFSFEVLFHLPSVQRSTSLKMVDILDKIENRWKKLQSTPHDDHNNMMLMEEMEMYKLFHLHIKKMDKENSFNYSYFEAQHKYIQSGLKKTLDRLLNESKQSSSVQKMYDVYQATFERNLFEMVMNADVKTEKKKVKI